MKLFCLFATFILLSVNTAGQVRPITCKAGDSIRTNEKAKTGNNAKFCKDAIQKHNYLIIDYNFLNDIRVNRQQIFSGLEVRYRGTIMLQIRNINKFIYNVSIETRETDLYLDQEPSVNNFYNFSTTYTPISTADLIFPITRVTNEMVQKQDELKKRQVKLQVERDSLLGLKRILLKNDTIFFKQLDSLITYRLNCEDSMEKLIAEQLTYEALKNSDSISKEKVNQFNEKIFELTNRIRYINNFKIRKYYVIQDSLTKSRINLNMRKLSRIDSCLATNDSMMNKWDSDMEKYLKADQNEKLTQLFLNEAFDLRRSIDKLQEIQMLYRNLLGVLYSDCDSLPGLMVRRDRLIENIFSIQTGQVVDIQSLCWRRYQQVQAKIIVFDEAYQNIPRKDSVSAFYTQFRTKLTQLNQNYFNALFAEIQKIYNAFNPQNFNITSPEFTVETDEVNFNLKITPKENLAFAMPTTRQDIDFKVRVRRGWKLDFSTGVFLNYKLNDRSYSIEPIPTDSFRIKENKNVTALLPSVGFMLHIYPRWMSDFNAGGCFGISTSNGTDIKYYLGGSMILGRRQRFIISVGAACGKYKTLDGMYITDKGYPDSKQPMDIPLTDAYGIGGFLAVTFNITAPKYEQIINKTK